MLSQQTQFIRTKQYMKSLNELLEHYEHHNIEQIKQLHAEKANKKSQNRPKTFNVQRLTFSDITNPLKLNPLASSRFLRSRSVSSLFQSVTNNQQKNIKTSQQQRKQKMVSILSMQNVRKQLMNTRKLSAVHTQQKMRDNRARDKKSNECDLRFNLPRKHNEIQQNTESKTLNKQEQNIETEYQLLLSKNQDQRNVHTVYSSKDRYDKNNLYFSVPHQTNEKKQFLRKGSSINKSILNTIIRLKLAKKSNTVESDPQKYIQNAQIVKMIKVYKGVQVANTFSRAPSQMSKSKQLKKSQKDGLHLEGWHNDTDEFDLGQSRNRTTPKHTTSCQI